ncbi:MAG: hypothetical protein AB8B56_04865 [Crocinitomicaceae bacterium]
MKKVTAKKKGLQAFAAISVKEMTNVKGGVEIRSNGFVWKGGGGCRYCYKDNQD